MRRWAPAGLLLLLVVFSWIARRPTTAGDSEGVEPVAERVGDGSPVLRGLEYLSRYAIEELGIEYTPTDYDFALSYGPEGTPELGNHFVAAYVLEAYRAAGMAERADSLGGYLSGLQEPGGLFPFDRFKYSIDADTTMSILIALEGTRWQRLEAAMKALRTIETEHKKLDCAYGTYALTGSDHPNAGPHPEITYNVLYLRMLLLGLSDAHSDCVADAIMMHQREDGFFPSYWYPERLHVHYTAIRALDAYRLRAASASGRRAVITSAIQRAIEYLLESQRPDGGWGPESNAFDTAFAIRALHQFARDAGTAARRALEKGRDFLVSEQLGDGSWSGVRIFYWYYPECEGTTCPEEWHDRDRRILTTAAAVAALASMK